MGTLCVVGVVLLWTDIDFDVIAFGDDFVWAVQLDRVVPNRIGNQIEWKQRDTHNEKRNNKKRSKKRKRRIGKQCSMRLLFLVRILLVRRVYGSRTLKIKVDLFTSLTNYILCVHINR